MEKVVDIRDIIPYANNPRNNDGAVDKVAESIRQCGYISPIVVDENMVVLAGHTRLRALKKLGYREVSVQIMDNLTDEQKKKFRLLDNKTSEFAEWDIEKLIEELDGLDFDGFDFGFDLDLDDDEPREVVEDDFDEELPEEPKAKRGQIYKLGNHRLMCGDSTSADDVNRLMCGVKADMVFTDPPYGVEYTGGMKIDGGKIKSNEKKMIKNDALGDSGLYEFLFDVFTNIKNNTNERSGIYVFYTHSRTREFINAFYDSGLKQRSIIIWHKTSGGFGDFLAQYMNAYEPCIYGSNGDFVNWYGASNEKTVWDMDKEKKCDLHPTMKPIPLVARAVGNSSKKGDNVLDLFGGSGSTIIACEQLERKGYSMELDPHYVDVIIERWEKFTGKKAELVEE